MANKGRGRKKNRTNNRIKKEDYRASGWSFASTVVRHTGFPGLVVLVLGSIVLRFSDPGQGKEIVDTWVLFKHWEIFPAIGFFVGIVILLNWIGSHYRRRYLDLQIELDRCASEKTALQEKLVGKPLHHSKGEEE